MTSWVVSSHHRLSLENFLHNVAVFAVCRPRITESTEQPAIGFSQPRMGVTGGSADKLWTAACHFMSGKPESVSATSSSLHPTGLAAGRNSCKQYDANFSTLSGFFLIPLDQHSSLQTNSLSNSVPFECLKREHWWATHLPRRLDIYLQEHFDRILEWTATVIPSSKSYHCWYLLCVLCCHLQGVVLGTLCYLQ